ncbi:hypothetical protein AK812_SmicGene11495 [Symbiodinium microadriaticum]|uniref:Uncharacterized protein n=1 Tax=Symbiodinium microadriaticum TaxID=2951 RepID=A0A1Q9ED16_SYMMI|nr:hypothetical protein AK812_SmicGene11495 [Symbiodinium microadriaticum]
MVLEGQSACVMASTSATALAPVRKKVIQELEAKLEQVEANIYNEQASSRKDLAMFAWKTARVLRNLIKPEDSEDRGMLWHNCKAALKDVLYMEKFNPHVFLESQVRDVLEKDIAKMLKMLLDYLKKLQSGKVKAPDQMVEVRPKKAAKREEEPKESKEEEEEPESGGWNRGWKRKGRRWNGPNWWENSLDDQFLSQGAVGIEDSDPEEECPDKAEFGSCAYGQQCGFCYR